MLSPASGLRPEYGHRYTWRLAFGLTDLEPSEQARGKIEP